jgi:hypothetical protein
MRETLTLPVLGPVAARQGCHADPVPAGWEPVASISSSDRALVSTPRSHRSTAAAPSEMATIHTLTAALTPRISKKATSCGPSRSPSLVAPATAPPPVARATVGITSAE